MPLTRQVFREHATVLPCVLNGIPLGITPKEFSTGSLGWYAGQKIDVQLNGETVRVQVGINLTIVGSKELPA